MHQNSLKMLADFEPRLSSTPNAFLELLSETTRVPWEEAQDHCVFSPFIWTSKADIFSPYQLQASIVGSLGGIKASVPVESNMLLYSDRQYWTILTHTWMVVFLKLDLTAGFMPLTVFQIFVHLVQLAPSLYLLSTDTGVPKMQCGKNNKFGHIFLRTSLFWHNIATV